MVCESEMETRFIEFKGSSSHTFLFRCVQFRFGFWCCSHFVANTYFFCSGRFHKKERASARGRAHILIQQLVLNGQYSILAIRLNTDVVLCSKFQMFCVERTEWERLECMGVGLCSADRVWCVRASASRLFR